MRNHTHGIGDLQRAGIAYDDALALRRISMTLHNWHEGECGTSDDYSSSYITRGRKEQIGGDGGEIEFIYDDNGTPFIKRHIHTQSRPLYIAIPDRERGALKRLAKIMARYPGFSFYVQGDPRGASLYILRPGDVPEDADVSSSYNRGIAVYK